MGKADDDLTALSGVRIFLSDAEGSQKKLFIGGTWMRKADLVPEVA